MAKKEVSIVRVPQILLPNKDIDMQKWAVIACDQYTSQKEYWDDVEKIVGNEPSTLRITFPEYYLGKGDDEKRIAEIQQTMKDYLAKKIFTEHDGMILVERQIKSGIRWGLLLCIDLEDYDFNKTSTSWIRATEGTVPERIPPRVKIREGAPLELPHILVLVNDPEKNLIEPLISRHNYMNVLYDFDLMKGSGHIRGYSLAKAEYKKHVMDVIAQMQADESIAAKYGKATDKNRILFAIGDGNHSLATAKTIWEEHKKEWGMNHPARYALVEIENLHDPALKFEPIHRVIFNPKEEITALFNKEFGKKITVSTFDDADKLCSDIDSTPEGTQAFGIIEKGKFTKVLFNKAPSVLCVGSVQQTLDKWKKQELFEKIDYIHGTKDLISVASGDNTVGIYLPPVQKNGFFEGIIHDGALPRKTFSMGEAEEKRFYIESRKILE